MLGKLLKYDFKALNRVMVPLQLGVLIAGVLGSFLLKFTILNTTEVIYQNYGSDPSRLPALLSMAASLLMALFFAAVFASFWVSLFLVARHFYKSSLRDEGYLTFTLPVSANKVLLSKTISGCVWLIINQILLAALVLFMLLVGLSESREFMSAEGIEAIGRLLSEINRPWEYTFVFELLFFALLMVIVYVLQLYFSLIWGSVLARTHKVLAAIGLYVVCAIIMQTVLSFILATAGVFLIDGSFTEYNWAISLQALVIPTLICYIGFAIAFYLLSKYLLKNKLNLD